MPGNAKRVLISGAGIAGPSLAWWLAKFGFEPTVIEIAPQFRSAGYMIDFWGKGFEIAGKMGLGSEIERRGYHVQEVRFVDSADRRVGGFHTKPFYRATDGRFISLPRGELAEAIWDSLPATVETRFGDEIATVEEAGEALKVGFAGGASDTFDLVIGADGLHSRVRELMFGPEDRYEMYLGYKFAVFTVEGYEPRTPDVYMMYALPGMQVSRFAMRGGRTMALFIWREEDPELPQDEAGRRALLRNRFSGAGWEIRPMLEALDRSIDLYVDRVSQIRMPSWSSGRVALVGDAAWAPSFLAGEGSGLGIIGAYVLAGELARSRDPSAFAAYEAKLRDFMHKKQKMASKFAGAFAPRTRFGVAFRNLVASTFNIPIVARLVLESSLQDDVDLPEYDAPDQGVKPAE